jgi:hypothetical protein
MRSTKNISIRLDIIIFEVYNIESLTIRPTLARALCDQNKLDVILGLLWIEENFEEKKNELSPHSKIPLFFLQNSFPNEPLVIQWVNCKMNLFR